MTALIWGENKLRAINCSVNIEKYKVDEKCHTCFWIVNINLHR